MLASAIMSAVRRCQRDLRINLLARGILIIAIAGGCAEAPTEIPPLPDDADSNEDGSTGDDGGFGREGDAAGDVTPRDAGPDGTPGTGEGDASKGEDSAEDGEISGDDAGPDTGIDASPDTGVDAGPDTSIDADPDTGVDADLPVHEYGLDERPVNATCVAPDRPVADVGVARKRFYDDAIRDLPAILDLKHPPGDDSVWYVVHREGIIHRFPAKEDVTADDVELVLDITERVNAELHAESGMFTMAFHPDFATNKYVYVYFTGWRNLEAKEDSRSFLARYKLIEGKFHEETIILPPPDEPELTNQPSPVHNGGGLAFGPDGYLYLGLGEGTSGNYSQDTSNILGAVLRIDVDNATGGATYAIPPDNPFANGQAGRPEIYAWGFRNPWRISFDRATGDLWLGDVGAGDWEEIDLVEKGGNYGWPIMEGNHCWPKTVAECDSAGLKPPHIEYPHNGNLAAVVGGYVYRGSAIPGLTGKYLYSDWVTGLLHTVDYEGNTPQHINLLSMFGNIYSFVEDEEGELFVAHHNKITGNAIYKLVPPDNNPAPISKFPEVLSATGCVNPEDPTIPASGLIPFEVNAPLWSDGATKRRWMALPDGSTIDVDEDGDWLFPKNTVLVKEFSLAGRRLETRLFIHHDDGDWAGYTYEWNDQETEAVLVKGGKVTNIGGQEWLFPNEQQCLVCHTGAAGFALGLETAQLNRNAYYPSTGRLANQLDTLNHIGVFTMPLPDEPGQLDSLPAYDDTSVPVEDRARGYLHANCANCHRPLGPAVTVNHDFRYFIPLADAKLCDVDPLHSVVGLSGTKLVSPGNAASSMVPIRMKRLDAHRMPPLASSIVDTQGVKLVENWIDGLAMCP